MQSILKRLGYDPSGGTERLDALAQTSQFAIVAVTLEGVVTAWNPAAEAMFGWAPDEVLGRPIPIMPDGADGELRQVLADRSRAGGFGQHEGVRVRKDGRALDVRVTTAPMIDTSGSVMGMLGIFQDIGERKQSDARQRAELTLLRALIDAIPTPVFFVNRTGVFLGCNAAFCDYVGEPHEDIVGRAAQEKWPRELAELYDGAACTLSSAGERVYEASVKGPDGAAHQIVLHRGSFFDADGELAGHVGTIVDLSERKRMEEALRESEERYRAVIASLHEGVILKHRDGRTLAHNAAAERLLGVSAELIAAHVGLEPAFQIVDAAGQPFAPGTWPLARTLASGEPVSNVVAGYLRPDGGRAWALLNAQPLRAPGEEAPHAVVVSFSDITERRVAEERLAYHAYHDPLTELPNRLLFEERLSQEMRAGRRFAVLYLDLDGFKRVNDTLGHAAGDALLEVVAARLTSCTRRGDTVARLGGDEFTIILSNVGDVEGVENVARRILTSVGMPIDVAGHEVVVGVSIGCALFPDHGTSLEALRRSADHAMYRAKEAGKNRICYSAGEDGEEDASLSLEAELRHAIDAGELELHYQPKVATADGALVGVEVLVRWNHPTRGLLAPGAFLPAAEQANLLGKLTEWVLGRACESTAAWLREGRDPPRVAVNVSAKQISDEALIELVTRALADTDLPASHLELELTEEAVMRNKRASARVLAQLRALGVTIAIDDFGTGYSSLSYLQQLPIDTLKIDRSFVMNMTEAQTTRPIVQAIASMAHALGMNVVAEGVETEEQLAELAGLGCEQVQGYFIARPMRASAFAARFLKPAPGEERPSATEPVAGREVASSDAGAGQRPSLFATG